MLVPAVVHANPRVAWNPVVKLSKCWFALGDPGAVPSCHCRCHGSPRAVSGDSEVAPGRRGVDVGCHPGRCREARPLEEAVRVDAVAGEGCPGWCRAVMAAGGGRPGQRRRLRKPSESAALRRGGCASRDADPKVIPGRCASRQGLGQPSECSLESGRRPGGHPGPLRELLGRGVGLRRRSELLHVEAWSRKPTRVQRVEVGVVRSRRCVEARSRKPTRVADGRGEGLGRHSGLAGRC